MRMSGDARSSEKANQCEEYATAPGRPVSPIRRVASTRKVRAPNDRFTYAAAGKVTLPFIQDIVLNGWGPFPFGPSKVRRAHYKESDLFARILLLEGPDRSRVCLIGTDLHGGSRFVTERLATLLAPLGLHTGNIFVSATHNHSGPGGLYGSRYYDAFGATTGMTGGEPTKLAFNDILAEEVARLISETVRQIEPAMQPARLGLGLGTMPLWSVNRSVNAFRRNFRDDEAARAALAAAGLACPDGTPLERHAVDPRVTALVALTTEARPSVIGAFATYGAHNALLARENQTQSSDYFGKAMEHAEAALLGATKPVVALVAGAIGDSDPLKPGPGDLAQQLTARMTSRCFTGANLKLIAQHGVALGDALITAVGQACASPHSVRKLATFFLEDRIAGASVGDHHVAGSPLVGMATLVGSELGRGNPFLGEGMLAVRDERQIPSQWPKRSGGIKLFSGDLQPEQYIAKQVDTLPMRLLRVDFEGEAPPLRILGLPGEPTLWTCESLRRAIAAASEPVMVTAVTGEYSGYLTTEQEYLAQHYEGGSTIWGRFTYRWLEQQARRLADGCGSEEPVGQARFSTEYENYQTILPKDGAHGLFKPPPVPLKCS